MKQTRASLFLACALTASMLGACTTMRSDDGVEVSEDDTLDFDTQTFRYTVAPGEFLGTIAQRQTGDIDNWTVIAQYNGIEDPRTLREGAVLVIPMNLVRGFDPNRPEASFAEARVALAIPPDTAPGPADEPSVLRIETPENDRVATASRPSGAPATATQTDEPAVEGDVSSESPAPVGTSTDVVNDTADDDAVEVVPVARTDTLEPTAVAVDDVQTIRIVGSYYPKGVYAEPSTSADLLMRVAPGTEFVLERSIDGWYRVSIESGAGYIRDGDARIVDGAS